jgi:hypothetical protein
LIIGLHVAALKTWPIANPPQDACPTSYGFFFATSAFTASGSANWSFGIATL